MSKIICDVCSLFYSAETKVARFDKHCDTPKHKIALDNSNKRKL